MKRIAKIALWSPVIVILTAFGLISFLGFIFFMGLWYYDYFM